MFEHITVLKKQAIEGLNIRPDGVYVDCTLGGGGHSEEILKNLDNGHLFAFEQDPDARAETVERLEQYKDRLTVIPENFRRLQEELVARGVDHVDGILYDLGVSSPQFDRPGRGFSYQHDGPLDMRMDPTQSLSAHVIVNEWPFNDLVAIFYKYGEEKFSKGVARKIEAARETKTIETTDELVELIKSAIPAPARRKGGHPAKRIFQALRIAVNDELGVFESSLKQAIAMTALSGRIAVITFHSLEDRICKQTFQEYSKLPELPPGMPAVPDGVKPILKRITRKPVIPGDEEIEQNRRARSAKLRVAEKIRMKQED